MSDLAVTRRRTAPRLATLCLAPALCVAVVACSAATVAPPQPHTCGMPEPEPTPDQPVREARVVELPLDEAAADLELELSGLAWFGDWLVLLPENLGRGFTLLGGLADGPQFVLAIPRADIEAMLDGQRSAPLEARRVPVTPDIEGRLPRFDGFEAIAFDGTTAWLTVETLQDETGHVAGVVVRGEMAPDLSLLSLDLDATATVRSQAARANASEEALVVHDGEVITLYELNGKRINPSPVAHVLDPSLQSVTVRPVPNLEYRITDATEVDAEGRFWVVNYSWPGSGGHSPDENVHPDPLRERHGCGETHALYDQVERLVELQLTPSGIELTSTPPIQLVLDGDWTSGLSRNWEGIARLDAREGFLVVTDRFPRTVLAFVAR